MPYICTTQASDNLTTNTENDAPMYRASLVMPVNETRDVHQQHQDAFRKFKYQTATSPDAKSWDPKIVPLMYPQLYPFGHGDPAPHNDRLVKISPENHYRHTLKLIIGKQQFAKHPEYLMERADTFNKSDSIRSTYVSLEYSADHDAITQITTDQVRNPSDLHNSDTSTSNPKHTNT
jgi:hypothetical protein